MSEYVYLGINHKIELNCDELKAIQKMYGNMKPSLLYRVVNFWRDNSAVLFEIELRKFEHAKAFADLMNSYLYFAEQKDLKIDYSKDSATRNIRELEKELENVKKRRSMIRHYSGINGEENLLFSLDHIISRASISLESSRELWSHNE